MRVVTVKLSKELDEMVTALARRRRTSRSEILREAIASFGASPMRSVTDAAGDLVGSIRGPSDLSTDPRHLAGFGE
jgi:hypothetical protein